MDVFNAIVDCLLLFYFTAFSWAPPMVPDSPCSPPSPGIAMLCGRPQNIGPGTRLKAVKNKVWAALFELRVYVDEPRVTWRAQKSLFAANLRYLGLAFRPALWMIVPMGAAAAPPGGVLCARAAARGPRGHRHHGDEAAIGIPNSPPPGVSPPPEGARHRTAGARSRCARGELAHRARQSDFGQADLPHRRSAHRQDDRSGYAPALLIPGRSVNSTVAGPVVAR